MRYLADLDDELTPVTSPRVAQSPSWRAGLPSLVGSLVALRELHVTDAPALLASLTNQQASRVTSPPPSTIGGFERFIEWTDRQRLAGQQVCFAVVPRESDRAIGIFQVRSLDMGFGTAEWGFAIASEFWGTGVFVDGAQLVVDFAFDKLGTYRLEARTALRNGRGNGALRKIGANQESILRQSLVHNGEYLDQALWTIFAEQWREARAAWGPRVRPLVH